MNAAQTVIDGLLSRKLVNAWKKEGPLRKFEVAAERRARDLKWYYDRFEPRMKGDDLIVDILPTWDYTRTQGTNMANGVRADAAVIAREAGVEVTQSDVTLAPLSAEQELEWRIPRLYIVTLFLKK